MKKFLLAILTLIILMYGNLFAYNAKFGVVSPGVSEGGGEVYLHNFLYIGNYVGGILNVKNFIYFNQEGKVNDGKVIGPLTEDSMGLSFRVIENNVDLTQKNFAIGVKIVDNYTSGYEELDFDHSPSGNEFDKYKGRYLEAIVYPIQVEITNDNEVSVTIPEDAKIYFKAANYEHNILMKGVIKNDSINGPVKTTGGGWLFFDPLNLIEKVRTNIEGKDAEYIYGGTQQDLVPSGIYDFEIVTNIPIGYIDNDGTLVNFAGEGLSQYDFSLSDIYGWDSSALIQKSNPRLYGTFQLVDDKVVTLPEPTATTTSGTVTGGTTTTNTDIKEAEKTLDTAIDSGDANQINTAVVNVVNQVIDTIQKEATNANTLTTSLTTATNTIIDTINKISDLTNLSSDDVSKIITETDTQVAKILDVVNDSITKIENVDIAQAKEITNNTAEMLSSVLKAATKLGTGISEDTVKKAQDLSQSVLTSVIDDLNEQTGGKIKAATTEELQKSLKDNPDILDDVLNVAGVDVTKAVLLSSNDLEQTAQNLGLSEQDAKNIVSALPQVVSPEAAVVNVGQTVIKTVDIITDSVKDVVPDVKIKSNKAGNVDVKIGSLDVSSYIAEVKIVSPVIPEGVNALPNGKIVSVKNGVAVVLTPAPKDPITMASTLQKSGLNNLKINNDGTINASNGDLKVVGSFGWVLGTTNTVADDNPKFEIVGTNPASENYYIKAIYPDGTSQAIAPFIVDVENFTNDMDKYFGNNYSIDRDKGILTLSQDGKDYKFKFSYLVESLTSSSSDYNWYQSNKDSNGLAYKVDDFNGDGVVDVKVFMPDGIQIIYGLK